MKKYIAVYLITLFSQVYSAAEGTIYSHVNPIVLSVQNNDANQVEELLQQGLDANSKNIHGLPLLAIAALSGLQYDLTHDGQIIPTYTQNNIDTINKLLLYGADPSLTDNNGKTAYDLLEEKKDPSLSADDTRNINAVLQLIKKEDLSEDEDN
jgi:ankyrin repeat protein